MAKYTRQDILDLIEEEDVKFIRLQFTDIAGNLKNMATTVDQIDKILGGRCRFNCAAVDGFRGVGYEELFLVPDLDTFVTFPWRPQNGKVARFICDIVKPDGTPFKGSSRYILKKVIAEAEQMGYTLDVGIKHEFFLFDLDENGEPTNQSAERGGYLLGLLMAVRIQDVTWYCIWQTWALKWKAPIIRMRRRNMLWRWHTIMH